MKDVNFNITGTFGQFVKLSKSDIKHTLELDIKQNSWAHVYNDKLLTLIIYNGVEFVVSELDYIPQHLIHRYKDNKRPYHAKSVRTIYERSYYNINEATLAFMDLNNNPKKFMNCFNRSFILL